MSTYLFLCASNLKEVLFKSKSHSVKYHGNNLLQRGKLNHFMSKSGPSEQFKIQRQNKSWMNSTFQRGFSRIAHSYYISNSYSLEQMSRVTYKAVRIAFNTPGYFTGKNPFFRAVQIFKNVIDTPSLNYLWHAFVGAESRPLISDHKIWAPGRNGRCSIFPACLHAYAILWRNACFVQLNVKQLNYHWQEPV